MKSESVEGLRGRGRHGKGNILAYVCGESFLRVVRAAKRSIDLMEAVGQLIFWLLVQVTVWYAHASMMCVTGASSVNVPAH